MNQLVSITGADEIRLGQRTLHLIVPMCLYSCDLFWNEITNIASNTLSTLSDSCKLRNFTVSRGHITRTYVNAWRSWLNKRSEFLCPLLYIQNYRFFDSEVKTFCYDFSNCNCGTKIWWESFCFTDWKCVWLLSISGVLCSRQHLEKVKTMWYTTTLGLGQLSQVFKIF